MDNKTSEKDRFFTVIKLLPDDEEIRKLALQHIETKLEFSLNDITLLSDPSNLILISEITKCFIISDVYAKILYYENIFKDNLTPKGLPPIHLLKRGDLPSF